MFKFNAFILLVALRIAFQPAAAKTTMAPFAKPVIVPSKWNKSIIIPVSYQNETGLLFLEREENELTRLFEREKIYLCKSGKVSASGHCTNKTEKAAKPVAKSLCIVS